MSACHTRFPLVLLGLMIACASAPTWSQETRRLFVDRFRDGIHIGAMGSAAHPWFYFSAGPFVGDDGVATVRRGSLHLSRRRRTRPGSLSSHTLLAKKGVSTTRPGSLEDSTM